MLIRSLRRAACEHLRLLPFRVPSGTTRVRRRTMAEFISARSGMGNPTHLADGPLGRATKSDPGAKMRSQHDSARFFFLLRGLALVMVWLNQQI